MIIKQKYLYYKKMKNKFFIKEPLELSFQEKDEIIVISEDPR